MQWPSVLKAARARGYGGPDRPVSDADREACASALWLAVEAKEGRRRSEYHGIKWGAVEIIEAVLSGRFGV